MLYYYISSCVCVGSVVGQTTGVNLTEMSPYTVLLNWKVGAAEVGGVEGGEVVGVGSTA